MRKDEENILLIPLLYFFVGLIMVAFFGCQSNMLNCKEEEPFVHTCPEKGHGDCPICFDIILRNEEVVVLD